MKMVGITITTLRDVVTRITSNVSIYFGFNGKIIDVETVVQTLLSR